MAFVSRASLDPVVPRGIFAKLRSVHNMSRFFSEEGASIVLVNTERIRGGSERINIHNEVVVAEVVEGNGGDGKASSTDDDNDWDGSRVQPNSLEEGLSSGGGDDFRGFSSVGHVVCRLFGCF